MHHRERALVVETHAHLDPLLVTGTSDPCDLEATAFAEHDAVFDDRAHLRHRQQLLHVVLEQRCVDALDGGRHCRLGEGAENRPHARAWCEQLCASGDRARPFDVDEHVERGGAVAGREHQCLAERPLGIDLEQCGPRTVGVERRAPRERVVNSGGATELIAGQRAQLRPPEAGLLIS